MCVASVRSVTRIWALCLSLLSIASISAATTTGTIGAAHQSWNSTTTGAAHLSWNVATIGVRHRSGNVTTIGAAASGGLALRSTDPNVQDEDVGDLGAQHYRRGDYAAAATAWTAAFEAATTERERARLAFNLGNAAHRRGAFLEAVGWYRASLARAPRSAATRHNLALARAEAGLAPADGGNLTGALLGALGAFTAAEAGWLALIGLGLLTAGILAEALVGGARGRLVLLVGALLALVAFGPWVQRATQPRGTRALVIDSDGLTARSEPEAEGKRMAKLTAGSEVMIEDTYLEWRRVRTPEGEFWVPREGLFVLR